MELEYAYKLRAEAEAVRRGEVKTIPQEQLIAE